jgi:hypothetical protein
MQLYFDMRAYGLLAMSFANANSRAASAEGYRCLFFRILRYIDIPKVNSRLHALVESRFIQPFRLEAALLQSESKPAHSERSHTNW